MSSRRFVHWVASSFQIRFLSPMAGKFIVVAAIAAIILTTVPAQGQSLSANPDSALQVFLKGIEGTHLTLEEAIRQGLVNAAAVRRAEASYNSAPGTVRTDR